MFHSSRGCKSTEAAKEEAAERAVDQLLEVTGAGVDQADRPTLTKYLKDMVQLVKTFCSGFWDLLRRCGVLERAAEEDAAFHPWLRGLSLADLQNIYYELNDVLDTREAFVAWAEERGEVELQSRSACRREHSLHRGVRMVEGQLRRHKICDFRGAAGHRAGYCAGKL